MTKGSHNSVLSTCDKGDNIGRRDWGEKRGGRGFSAAQLHLGTAGLQCHHPRQRTILYWCY